MDGTRARIIFSPRRIRWGGLGHGKGNVSPLSPDVLITWTDRLLNLYSCLAQTCSKRTHDLNAADLKLSQNVFFDVPLH
jgi:hypothetical protein